MNSFLGCIRGKNFSQTKCINVICLSFSYYNFEKSFPSMQLYFQEKDGKKSRCFWNQCRILAIGSLSCKITYFFMYYVHKRYEASTEININCCEQDFQYHLRDWGRGHFKRQCQDHVQVCILAQNWQFCAPVQCIFVMQVR